MIKNLTYRISILFLITFLSCETDKIIPSKGYLPSDGIKTESLNAGYFWITQGKLTSSYWKEADYVDVNVQSISTQNLYPEGYLNMTGTYNGLEDFNSGDAPNVKLKAGYDDAYLYILAEWNDISTDASNKTLIWDGPDDPLKMDSTAGWTYQENSDKFLIEFDHPDNTKDVWLWDAALSAPLSMAFNMSMSRDGSITNDNNLNYSSNTNDLSVRPIYEWNGERQELETSLGTTILDPAYYLLDTYKTHYIGNVASGKTIFNVTADCRFCHGPNGNGIPDDYTDGGSLQRKSLNRYSREGLIEFIESTSHEGRGNQYFGKIKSDTNAVNNLIAYIRGISGVPGNIIHPPENKDVMAYSNISIGGVSEENTTYKVLFIRKLNNNNNSNDVQFNTESSYNFSVKISDGDGINYIGSGNIELKFKSNSL